MPSKVVVRDRGANALKRRLRRENSKAEVTIGVHSAEGGRSHGDGATVADIGTFAELGLGQPQRSWLGGWADEQDGKNRDAMRDVARGLVKGRFQTVEQGLHQFGHVAVGEIQQRIADGIDPPNAESTIAQKGSSTPLIHTGVFRSSITHKVER